MAPLGEKTKSLLRDVSTATLTTALFKRGLRNVFLAGLRPVNPRAARMVGEAFTLRYIPAREDLDRIDVYQDPKHPQRAAIEAVPPGHVMVMDCRNDARAASGGGILMTRLMVRGAAGAVTDGGLRDTPEIAELDFPVFCRAPSAPLNLAVHHAVDMGVPIACAGVAVYPGDLIVGDGDGVVCLPRHLADEVAAEGWEQERKERFLTMKIRKGAPLVGTYPPNEATTAEYKKWLADGEPEL